MEPKEIQAEFDAETGKAEYIQCVPILEILKILLKKGNIFAYHIDQNNILTNNEEMLKCFRDGRAFQENALLSSSKNNVELILYHDDFNVVNPLGNKTVKYKTSAFYFILGKLP